MVDLWTYLKSAKKPIVLYGMGNGADKTVNKLESLGIKIYGVFSSDGFKKNKTFRGMVVTDYKTIKEQFGEIIILVCFGSHLESVIENIKILAKENELYAPDVAVCGEEIFDIDFAKKYSNELKKVYSLLADDISKKVFENTVYFKLTGKIDYLFEIESKRSEVFKLLNLGKSETFLDLGAFTGDTVLEFINVVGEYNKIIALEPDKRNYNRLVKNTENFKNIITINSAVNKCEDELYLTSNHSKGNSDFGKLVAVNATTIDLVSKEAQPSFIKIDVEGFEMKAIIGGEKTIKTLKPKMHIAAYHTPYDIFKIPLVINEMMPDYKIYMRHHPCIPAWDINYIFV